MKDLKLFEDALRIVKTGKDDKGNHYNNLGRLNQAAFIGERAGFLIEEIKRLQRKVVELEGHLNPSRRFE